MTKGASGRHVREEMTVGTVTFSVVPHPSYPPSCPLSWLTDPLATPIFRWLLWFSSWIQDTELRRDEWGPGRHGPDIDRLPPSPCSSPPTGQPFQRPNLQSVLPQRRVLLWGCAGHGICVQRAGLPQPEDRVCLPHLRWVLWGLGGGASTIALK